MNPSEAAQALFRYNLMQDFRIANYDSSRLFTILRKPTSFFPHPDGFYSEGKCNGVSEEFYRLNKGPIDRVYLDLAQAFNGQLNRPVHSSDAEKFAKNMSKLWGRGVVLLDGMNEPLARCGGDQTLKICMEKRRNEKGFNYHVDGYLVMSPK